jgi:predicted transcriptional regulator
MPAVQRKGRNERLAESRTRKAIAEAAQEEARALVAQEPRPETGPRIAWNGKPAAAFTDEDRTEAFAQLFAAMAGGQTLAQTARELGLGESTLRMWLQADAGAMQRYRRAKQLLGQALAEQALTIALNTTVARFQADRLKVDTLKWLAARINPEEFGERTMHEQTGEVVVKVQVVEEDVPVRQRIQGVAQTLQIGATESAPEEVEAEVEVLGEAPSV